MKVQSISPQASYNHKSGLKSNNTTPVSFTGARDELIKTASHKFINRVYIKKPTIWERLLGHRLVDKSVVIYKLGRNFKQGCKLTTMKTIRVNPNVSVGGELNVGKNLYIDETAKIKKTGKVNVGVDMHLRGDSHGEVHVGNNFHATASSTIHDGNISAHESAYIDGQMHGGTLKAKQVIVGSEANVDKESVLVGKSFHLAGGLTNGATIIAEKFTTYGGRTAIDTKTFCKEVGKIWKPEYLLGDIYTEKVPMEIYEQHPKKIHIQNEGWYDKFFGNYMETGEIIVPKK